MSLLRANLLAGRRIAVSQGVCDEVSHALTDLGAEVEVLCVEELPTGEERAGEWARARSPLHALVYAPGTAFGSGDDESLVRCLDDAWAAVRELAVGALIEGEDSGKLVLLAPRADAGPLAGAAGAGLENLVRTLSVEWARYGLTAVLLAPGATTTSAEITGVVTFLVSEGGGYLSGCRLDLGEVS